MVIVNFQGRLANNIFQFISAYFFSKKHNLPIYLNHNNCFIDNNDRNSSCQNLILKHHTKLLIPEKESIIVGDHNFISYYNMKILPDKNYFFEGYFQKKDFISELRNEIKILFQITYDKNVKENDVFVHYRLGDLQNSEQSLPVGYYIEALSLLGYPSGYISSDSIDHKNCKILIEDYNLKPIKLNPWDTILFGKNFNKLILSEGSFSAIIGVFSKANTIISNYRELKWGGDICNGLEEHVKLSWGYEHGLNPINYNQYK